MNHMSKNRPRRIPAPAGRTTAPAPDWEQRVFQNTYTHNGRLVKVKGWSVKIQYEGARRTLSLTSQHRADAAREAARLYKKIISQGWSSVSAGSKTKSAAATERLPANRQKTGVRYWENRL